MTDEQLGRLWCERNGKRPSLDATPESLHERPWVWVYDDGPANALPSPLFDRLCHPRHRTPADAYSAVGAALRDLHRLAEEIRGILGGVL